MEFESQLPPSATGAKSAPAVVVAGIGSATPDLQVDQQHLWTERLSHLHSPEGAAARSWQATTVRTRHLAIDPYSETPSDWPPSVRMSRYLTEAVALSVTAASKALAQMELQPTEIGLLAVASSTPPFTHAPGVELLVAKTLGLPGTARRLRLGPIGCHAALPLIALGSDFAAAQGQPALLVAVELTSLLAVPHVAVDNKTLIGHALFADAAAAVVVAPVDLTPTPAFNLRIVSSATITLDDYAGLLTWNPEDTYAGLEMGLSPRLPVMVGRYLADALAGFLRPHGLTAANIDHWAVHPGGPDILKVVTRTLHLESEALQTSYDILAEFGNCSSATVLLVLQRLQETHDLTAGQHVLALAFGPGLTIAVTLLAQD